MLYERKKILTFRIIMLILFLLSFILTVISITIFALNYNNMNHYISDMKSFLIFSLTLPLAIIFFAVFIICLISFIYSFQIKYKVYEYNSNDIVVYAGYSHHYMKVNGDLMDEYNKKSNTPIYLSCRLDDGSEIQATIFSTNNILLKINDKHYTKTKEIE